MWAKLKKRSSGEANKQMTMSKNRSSSNVVDKEYVEALHTKSFVDVYSRFQPTIRVQRSTTTTFPPTTLSSKNTSNELQRTFSSPLCNHEKDDRISDFPLEFMQESLLTVATSPNSTSSRFLTHLNNLFLDFYDTNAQVTAACTSLLSSINCARSHHRNIHRLLSSSSSSSSPPCAFSQLSSLLELDNPVSHKTLSHFHSVHSHYPTLICALTSANQKISRRLKLCRITKYASSMSLVALSAAVAAMIVIASHGAAAVLAMAPIATAGIGLKGRTGKRFRGWKRLRAKVDVAAKAAYIVGRDLDTLSQIVRRVHDEVEHVRDMARMVVEKREWHMVKEMERRGEMGLGLEEHLKELEEHVYLCLTAITRSWRIVAQKVVDMQREK